MLKFKEIQLQPRTRTEQKRKTHSLSNEWSMEWNLGCGTALPPASAGPRFLPWSLYIYQI